MMLDKKIILPKLQFGENKSIVTNNFNEVKEYIHEFTPSLKILDSVYSSNSFASKSFEIDINGLNLISFSATPMYLEQYPTKEENYLYIPTVGGSSIVADNKKLDCVAMKKALFHSYMTQGEEREVSSFVIMPLDKKRLLFTAKSMLGEESKYINVDFDSSREVLLDYYQYSFSEIFLNIFKMIEQYNCNKTILENIKLDDILYRNIVTMLNPKIFIKDAIENTNIKSSKKGLVNIFNFVEQYPNENLTLTDLENISGLSSRTLQYTFHKELSTTPTKFLRSLGLKKAKRLLLNNKNNLSITQIALECGFSNHSFFSKYFKEEFGVTPSQFLINN